MKPHAFHPKAEEEYTAAARYYVRIQPELGGRFHDEMERFWKFDPPARRHLSNVFPYAVIYVAQADRIWILAVMHLKRRPGYWKHRAA